MTVKFNVTKPEFCLIEKVAKRANLLLACSLLDTEMDFCAVIAQGQKLDLDKLLSFNDFNFVHDVAGIEKHINRNTGKLENHFFPRCAK